jgi:hypothetical protein
MIIIQIMNIQYYTQWTIKLLKFVIHLKKLY